MTKSQCSALGQFEKGGVEVSFAQQLWRKASPNTRVQRTRSSPSAPHSPLTRCPLGNAINFEARRRSMLIRSASRFLGALALLAFGPSAMPAETTSDTCQAVFFGAKLSGSLLDVSLTLGSLKLLNGNENPKLRHFLEWRLANALQDARRDIDHGPVIEPVALPLLALNFGHDVAKARAYVSSHHLERFSSYKEDDPERFTAADTSVLKPAEDLAVVEKWLARQPLPPASER
jgi:hypothetical protein